MARLPKLDKECFFIAPIGQADSEVRRRSDSVLKAIVQPAAKELSLEAVRADRISESGAITHQVIEHVIHAKAVVADLTGHNPNVFYELAIRHSYGGAWVQVIEEGEEIPFDVGAMRTIRFRSTDLGSGVECKEEVVAQLRRCIDEGFNPVSPVSSTLDVLALRKDGALERTLVQILAGQDRLVDAVTGLRNFVVHPTPRLSSTAFMTQPGEVRFWRPSQDVFVSDDVGWRPSQGVFVSDDRGGPSVLGGEPIVLSSPVAGMARVVGTTVHVDEPSEHSTRPRARETRPKSTKAGRKRGSTSRQARRVK